MRAQLSAIILALSCCNAVAAADVQVVPEAQICLGYDPENDSWGAKGIVADHKGWRYAGLDEHGWCPKGHAFVSVRRPSGRRRDGAHIPVVGTCCPIPRGVLLDEHSYDATRCPANSIATGVQVEQGSTAGKKCEQGNEKCREQILKESYLLRCTKIDRERFQLGPSRAGLNWGWYRHFTNQFEQWTTRNLLPVAMRYSIGRINKHWWQHGGCIGYPWGSILVQKHGKGCPDFQFSQLQYRGKAPDPPAGTPVQLFPNCSSLSSRFDPQATCIP